MNILMGIIGIVVGFMFVWKTEAILRFAGRIDWAERHLGTEGGSRLLYKLMGILAIFIGGLAVTGLYQQFLEATIGRLFLPSL